MAFQSNVPIIGAGFQNRSEELQRLDQVARRLANGEPSWLAILGPRKVGKTSLVLEFARRHASKLHVVSFDVSQWSPVSWEVFRNLALRAIDELAGASTGVSFEALADDRGAWRETVSGTELFARLPPRARSTLVALPELAGPELARRSLELPELVAEVMDRPLVVAVDEFQELAQLGAGRKGVDPFPIVRAVWQHHRRVAYVVSGSEQSMMLEMVSSKASPFFQHFSVLELGVFDEEHAVRLLTEGSPADRPIPRSLAERAVQTLGTHPFYLQMLGEALVASPPPYDDHDLKAAIQELVFARAGRLSLFFGRQWDGLVGRSTTLAATLEALSLGNTRVKDVASAVGTTAGATLRYLERLGDSVRRNDDGGWRITDPLFSQWVAWRRPGGSVVPMQMLGEEGEREAAEHLASLGFDLVYQSRGSRGAFDLLATRGHHLLAIQVKRRALPLRFSKTDWNRMEADAKRFGWRWAIAAVTDGDVLVLDPRRAKKGREVRLDAAARIDNLLAWLDRP